MALRGSMPVAVAMWLPNAIFGVAGLILLQAVTDGLPASWGRLLWRLRAARAARASRGVFPKRAAVERRERPRRRGCADRAPRPTSSTATSSAST